MVSREAPVDLAVELSTSQPRAVSFGASMRRAVPSNAITAMASELHFGRDPVHIGLQYVGPLRLPGRDRGICRIDSLPEILDSHHRRAVLPLTTISAL